ncbi:MAG: glycine zipper 2TM domain-containing protein [Burkholderiales bacterium]|nr:MAG: glycine zipper 2TM domain-containing protein [Burkholderiales bacterium]
MKNPSRVALIPLAAGLIGLGFSGLAQARDERARVISSTPLTEQVQVPQEVCQDQVVTVPGRKTGAGAVMGGIAGGAMGNAIGDGSGRAIATVIGLVGGAMIGDRIEGRGPATTQVVRQCSIQHVWQQRTVGHDVVYEYAGRQYRTRMAEKPGRWIRVSVQPVVAGLPAHPGVVHVDAAPARPGPGWRHQPHNRHWQPYGY